MASYKDWNIAYRNASAAGDQEAMQEILGHMQEAGIKEGVIKSPTEGMSGLEKFTAGLGRGMVNIGRNVGNMVGLVSDTDMKEAERLDKPLMETGAGKAGSFVGETAALLPVGGLATSGVRAIAPRVASTVGQRLAQNLIARGAIEGATQGAITAGPDERLSGAATGAALGAAFPVAGAAVKGAAAGIRPTRSAQTLLKEGVELTPGQMSPSGSINQLEQALMAVPFIGKAIAGQREKGWQQVQNVIGEKASPPGFKPQTIGDVNKLVDEIGDAYNTAYKVGEGYPISTLSILKTNGQDIPLSKAFKSSLTSNANPDAKQYAQGFLENELQGLIGKRGNVMSDDLFDLRSRIRAEVRRLEKSQNAPYGASDILQSAEKKVTEAIDSHLPADVIPAVRAIDAKYGNYKVLQNAVKQAGDRPEGFTPAQFSQAVRQDALSLGDYASGGGRMRPLAKAGYETFQPNQPMTGRQAVTLAPLGYALAKGLAVSPLATGAAAVSGGALWGTKTGRELLAGDTKVQELMRDLMRKGRRNLTPNQREAMARLLQTGMIESAVGNEQGE